MNYQTLAEKAVEEFNRIEDFGYWGELPLGKTWAFTFSVHRDSDLLDQSNFECIQAILEKEFSSNDFQVENCNHWAVGWIDHLAVRMLDDNGQITPIGIRVLELKEALESYPVLDEEDFSRREYEAKLECISNQGYTSEQATQIDRWLWDNRQEAFEHEDNWIPEEDINFAAVALGLKEPDLDNPEDLEAVEYLTDYNWKLERGYFNKNQLKLNLIYTS